MTQAASPNGEVLFEGDLATLLYKRHYAHSPESVWAALTDPSQLRRWLATSAKLDGRTDGSIDFVSGPSAFHIQGRIIEWNPPKVFEHEWNVEPRTELPKGEQSFVRWELAPVDGGTLLTLTHRRLTRGTALGFAPGWHAYLDRLVALLDDAPLPDWQGRYQAVQSAYPSWGGPPR